MTTDMHEWRKAKLQEFVAWSAAHVTGDEKGQAQVFLDRLFIAFGQKGSLDVGGTAEMRIRKSTEDGGGTSFADYVWKPVVLIEMKKRGVPLAKHRQQALNYWTHIAPGRPKYVILCNFDEFWVYDFNTQLYDPKDTVKLTDLPDRWEPLAFLFPTGEPPRFGNDREKVTREAADKLALCFKKLLARDIDRDLAQRFVLQSMIAMFAEDIGLLPKSFFLDLLDECKQPSDSYDKLGGLFEAMNTHPPVAGGRYKGVKYFNGGIFKPPARIELNEDELNQLRGVENVTQGAAQSNWAKVEPEIFGAIFQESMNANDRHAYGAHFTSAEDIMKIVKPTICDPWDAAIAGAKTAKKLNDLLERLATLRVLDPACGSGNFLYIAYREMKEREARIRERLTVEFPSFPPTFAHVNARQFFGMDINPFAVELAKVTLMIARKLAINDLHLAGEADLPLDNLDANFRVGDALITTDELMGKPVHLKTPWPPADVIIGNPPFLDARKLTVTRGRTYVAQLEKLYPTIARRADYCTYWLRRANDHLPTCTVTDAFVGRAGLVGTQNIRNNESREGGLDEVVRTGTIVEAIENQPWSGEANVHVSIANWIKTHDPTLAPKEKRLWSRVKSPVNKMPRKKGERADKIYDLVDRNCSLINAALSDETDVTQSKKLACNTNPKVVFEGVQTGHDGFVIKAEEAKRLIAKDERYAAYLKPFLNGTDLLSGRFVTKREFVVDMSELDMVQAAALPDLIAIPRERVLPDWQKNASAEQAATQKDRGEHQNRIDEWWALKRPRGDLQRAISRLPRYVACSAVMKRPIFVFLSQSFLPTNALKIFAFADDYSYGILQSDAHWQWFFTKCSKLKSDFRYTPDTVFDTFPWPQSPTKAQIDAIAAAGREVRRVRDETLKVIPGGLRAVYRTLELPGKHPLKAAHAALDAAVLAAYGFAPDQDLLAQLLVLNKSVFAQAAAGQTVTAPGVPPTYDDPAALVTDDCIRS